MTSLRRVHHYMSLRRRVLLDDGRTGRIVRIDTKYPANETTVSVWTDTQDGPGLAKIDVSRVVGLAPNLVVAS